MWNKTVPETSTYFSCGTEFVKNWSSGWDLEALEINNDIEGIETPTSFWTLPSFSNEPISYVFMSKYSLQYGSVHFDSRFWYYAPQMEPTGRLLKYRHYRFWESARPKRCKHTRWAYMSCHCVVVHKSESINNLLLFPSWAPFSSVFLD